MRSTASLALFLERGYGKRKWVNRLACAALGLAALLALVPLLSIFGYVVSQGWPALNASFFTELPKPVGEAGGGMVNALWGTIELVAIASLIGVVWGIAAGLYLSEFGRGRVGTLVRFATEMLASVPSILIGLFVYVVVVRPMGHFSVLAGGLALGILMIPTVARVTEELLRLVPGTLREAGLALGLPRWKVILQIVLRGSTRGILTGVMLAVARVAGETAPLLFTAFGNPFWNRSVLQPTSSVPVQIYTYAISPFDEWHRLAWAGALVLIVLVFAMNLLTRVFLRASGTAAAGQE